MFKLDDPANNRKNVIHAFFLALAVTIAEPSTILPLMVSHFTENAVIIGIFVSLLRGGAIVVQLYAAFHAQVYTKVISYLRRVFFFRFASWLLIGVSILLFGQNYPNLTLLCIGIGLFFFSFTAGFGAIYFKELQAKLFTKKYRGKTMSNRMVARSVAAIISGGVAGWVLSAFDAPMNFAYLFMVSSLLMAIGFISFGTINEPVKNNIGIKEEKFRHFLKNAAAIIKANPRLRLQIFVIFLANSYFLAMPFVILDANSKFELTGWMLGGFISIQMLGSIVGSSLLWRRIHDYEKMLSLSIVFLIAAFVLALFAESFAGFVLIFLLFGIALDGIKISDMNLVIEIAPEDKRPIYSALQVNLTSIGLFFPVLGGALLNLFGSYIFIYICAIVLLIIAAVLSLKIKKIPVS